MMNLGCRNQNDEFFMYDMSRFIFMFKENMPNWKIDKWLYND